MMKLNALALLKKNSKTKSIQYENLEAMCLLLNCTPNELLVFTEEE